MGVSLSACTVILTAVRRCTPPRQVGGMKRGRAALGKNAVFAVLEGASAGDHEFGSVPELAAAEVFGG